MIPEMALTRIMAVRRRPPAAVKFIGQCPSSYYRD
jgi:hypothetical protein